MQKNIVKLVAREELTASGFLRTVYKRTIYTPSHPDYAKEKLAQDEYFRKNFMPKEKE